MVTGLNLFRDHFAAYGDRYVLIGGAACDMLMQNAGLPFARPKISTLFFASKRWMPPLFQAFWNFCARRGLPTTAECRRAPHLLSLR
jgi:hypothetical protein